MAAKRSRTPLTADERDGIILTVSSVFRKLKNLYAKIVSILESCRTRDSELALLH